jgi:hypothetical protein
MLGCFSVAKFRKVNKSRFFIKWNKIQRNETKNEETKRNEMKYHKTKRNTTKRNEKWNEIENGRQNNRSLKEIKPIFTIAMLDYFPHMSVFHQERTGFCFVFVDFVSFRFVFVDFVSFRFYFVSHFIGAHEKKGTTKLRNENETKRNEIQRNET